MKEDTLRILEFERVLEAISEFSHSDATKRAIHNIRPLNDRESIENRFSFIKEFRRLNEEKKPLKLTAFDDIAPYIERLKPKDAILEARELYSFIPVLRMIEDISSQIKENERVPFLKNLIRDMCGFPEILFTLEMSVDSEGNILDTASSLLSKMRAEIRSLEKNIRKKLEEKMSERNIIPFLQDNFIAQRAGRRVIPVRMDSKTHVPGVVHDISRSGETAFIEPLEIIGHANELENLIAEEKAEMIRILKAISGDIRDVMEDLSKQFETIVHLDLLNSILRFSEIIKMEIPEITNSQLIKLVRARHPILELIRIKNAMKNVVPLDLELGGKNTVMVITGPNAGGKTIAIKTVGLLLLMALCGIPVPADSSSVFPFVKDILVDIGDEQSIDFSLSTFSAHVSKISQILKSESKNAVVLLDELGTGTEPSQGSAIACSVLNDLKEKRSLVFATTHLIEIVSFIYRTEGMLNASMEFDSENHTPLYKLRIGEPGQSHALEIAVKYGLPQSIINSARDFLGKMNLELYDLISDLRKKRNKYEEALKNIEEERKALKARETILKEKFSEHEKKTKEIEEKAYREAEAIIRETKQKMYCLIEETKKKERDAIKKAEKLHKEVTDKLKTFKKESFLSIDDIKAGDTVYVKSIGYDGEVIGIDRKRKRLKVRAKGIEIEVSESDITVKKGVTPQAEHPIVKIPETHVSSRLNLIGMRVDEAISRLEPFLNHATLSGLDEVKIVHGVGTGALLRAVHEHLKGHPLIKEFRSGELNEGGRGVTIVKLK